MTPTIFNEIAPFDRGGLLPVATYLARLGPGSRRTMKGSLDFIAREFSGGGLSASTFPWCQLRYEHTQLIRATLEKRYAPKTANKMLTALRGVLKECWRLGQLTQEDLAKASDIQPIRGSRVTKGRALTDAELSKLTHAGIYRNSVLIRLMVATGLRREEAAKLRWEDATENGGAFRVRGKGNKERLVPIPDNLAGPLAAINVAATQRDSIFGVSAGRIAQILREQSFRGGIEVVTPHDLRRTYITRLLAANVDLATVQRLAGHSNPQTTASYDRRGIEQAAADVNRVFKEV